MGTLLIKGGRLLSPTDFWNQSGDLLIVDGLISQVGDFVVDEQPDKVINAEGNWVVPSFIDLSHDLREPGFEHKATIASECIAASKAGFSSVCCLPATMPVNDSAAVTNFILDQAAAVGNISVYPIGAMTKLLQGEQLSEMFALREAGCIAVTNLRKPFKDLLVARRCLEYACSLDIKVIICPQDWVLAGDGCAHDGALASQLGLPAVPSLAETLAVAQWLILAEETQARIHFGQLSTARSVAMIAEAKSRGLSITADVALANLCYTDQMLRGYNSMCHVQPPLRSESDRLGLLRGVNDGTIDAICSHHQPHEQSSKQAPFAETSAGMSQVELVWPQLLNLVNKQELELIRAIESFTVGPAQAMSLETPCFSKGQDANVTIVDTEKKWLVDIESLSSAGKNTPLLGAEVTGKPGTTLYKGNIL